VGWPLAVLVGTAVGLFSGWLSQQSSARRRLPLIHLLLILGFAAAALIPLYRLNVILPARNDRQANFERLWRAMDRYYPYFELKGVDWDERRLRRTGSGYGNGRDVSTSDQR
jgi:carboxyl-terminal processing protease